MNRVRLGVVYQTRMVRLLSALFCATALVSCASSPYFTESPGMPEIVAPVEGSALIVNAQTRFEWRPVERATHYDFHLFDRKSGDINRYYRRDMISESVCSENICSVSVTVALPYQSGHAWRVRAGNHVGKSTWTRTMFTMVNGGVGPSTQ